ncbi:carbohydrate-binding module family 5/12 [Vibrio phage 2.275.O._10N.286.54.E11]|nr:carbohydrate-binding module family 5/12 [Vibrio phage 2.275.O._10N.286.54.E11]
MAIQNRQSNLFAAEDWTVVYQAFRQIDLQSYDYDTIRESMVNHLRVTYPDTFNDWIENDEFIFILDTISYLGQNLAFRMDLNTRENFIDTASRRESVLRLASMLSYNPRRNYPSRGLVKLNQIQTTYDVRDSNGNSLSGVPIRWNDPLNPDWYEQFILVMNSCFIDTNPFGNPVKRFSDGSITSHMYQMNTVAFSNITEKFSANVNGQSMNFEVVNPDIDSTGAFVERSPEPQNSKFMIYRSDGNGFSSPDTGFFLMFKQGALKFDDFEFDLEIENRTVDIDVANINEIDVWVQEIASDGVVTDHWNKVPSTQNITYNSIDKQVTKIFSVITNDSDKISIRFPDSLSGTVPRGTFRIWYRTSNGLSYTIRTNDIQNNSVSYSYTVASEPNAQKSLDMQFSLQYQVQNAQAQETIDQIRVRAPQNYYTQNRLITGEDYNIGPLQQGNLVLKSKAVNRTYSGHSRFIDINDPTGKYQNVDVFSEYGVLYNDHAIQQTNEILPTLNSWESVIINKIQPIISEFSTKTLYQETGDDGIYWNNNTTELNRKNLVQVSESVLWEPTPGKTPYGLYGKFSPVVTDFTPVIGPGAVILFENTNDSTQRVWSSINSYDSATGEYSLSTAVSSANWQLIQYFPDLRSIFNSTEIARIITKLEQSENFGLTYDLESSTWNTIPVTASQIATWTSNTWEDLPLVIDNWSTTNPYTEGDFVIYGTDLWRCDQAHAGDTTFDFSKWVFVGSNVIRNWEPLTTYTQGQKVVVDGTVYECITEFTSGLIFNESNWENAFVPTQNPNIRLWEENTSYETNDMIRYGTTLYIAIADFTSVTFNPANWAKIYGSEPSIYDPVVLCNYTSKTWDFISPGIDYIFYGDNIGFYFTKLEDVPDINTGLAQSDLIKILRSNHDPFNSGLGYNSDSDLDIAANVYQIDGYTDYTRVKVAPTLDLFNNPLNPSLMESILGGGASEDVFWRRNDDNTESYMDLTLVRRDETERITYDSLVEFFILSNYTEPTETYGKRQLVYGSEGTIFAFIPDNEVDYKYYKITSSIDETNALVTIDIMNTIYNDIASLDAYNMTEVDNILHHEGRISLHFLWKHFAPSNHRIDPAITNIHDIYVLTTAYNDQVVAWAAGDTTIAIPAPPTSTELRETFTEVEDIKAISDTVIWHSARYIPLFGAGAEEDYQATFSVVRAQGSSISDDEIRQQVISLTNTFFDVDNWDFGESFFFTELAAYIHQKMVTDIASVVIVPSNSSSKFGTLFEISAEPDQVFVNTASVNEVNIIDALTVNNIRIGF